LGGEFVDIELPIDAMKEHVLTGLEPEPGTAEIECHGYTSYPQRPTDEPIGRSLPRFGATASDRNR
jgi:hypothetical protein